MVAKLRAPCDKQKEKKLATAIKVAEKDKKAAADSLAKAGQSASFQKYALKRQGLASFTAERLAHLEGLRAAFTDAKEAETVETTAAVSNVVLEIMCVDIATAFAAFDKNGDGIIDKDELVCYCHFTFIIPISFDVRCLIT